MDADWRRRGDLSYEADLNKNGCVDDEDVVMFHETFGKRAGEPGFNPDADFDNDGHVSIRDWHVMREQYGLGNCGE